MLAAMRLVWSTLFILVISAEVLGLWKGGPLTHYVVSMQATTPYRCAQLATYLWLGWHWFLKPQLDGQKAGLHGIDAAVAATGILIAALLMRAPRPMKEDS